MIVITGAAQGLGKACALTLAKQGHDLLLQYRKSQKKAEEVAAQCEQHGVKVQLAQGDFSDRKSLSEFCKALQQVDVKGLVNNVGAYFLGNASQTTEDQWFNIFQVNLHAPFCVIKAVLPALQKNRGRIVNIGTAGLRGNRANTHATAYTLTKGALEALSTSLAKGLAGEGVTVNMVSPGYLEISENLKDPSALPMKRAARFEEAAALVAFFFKEEAAYITGQNVEIAGAVAL